MATLVKYIGYVNTNIDTNILNEIVSEWQQTLKASKDAIYNGLMSRISDEADFITVLVDPAVQGYSEFVNPNFPDAEFIKLKHNIKLRTSYSKWKQKIDEAFTSSEGEPTKFEKGVDSAVPTLPNRILYVIASTGYRPKLGRGVAYRAIGVISGDYRVVHDIPADDVFEGSVVNVFPSGVAKLVRPQAVAIITKGIVLALYAHTHGYASLRDSVISAVNDLLAKTVLKQVDVDPNTGNPKYNVILEMGYDDSLNKIYVHSQADTVT